MIISNPAIPEVNLEQLSLYYAIEPLLGNKPIVVFYGPSTTANLTQNSSRIQAHVYSLAGFYSFPRLTVAPTSPLYAAVNHLPSDLQGDDITRGLAIGLLSCFAAIPKAAKAVLKELANSYASTGIAPAMFDEMHAADLAADMIQTSSCQSTWNYLASALGARTSSWIDMDVLLPTGTIHRASNANEREPLVDEHGLPLLDYGRYNSLIRALGSSTFLPTTKLQRAPSKHSTQSHSKTMSKEEKISLRREMCELVDTECNYLKKLRSLLEFIAPDAHQHGTSDTWRASTISKLRRIHDVNEVFCREIQSVLETTEADAIQDIEMDTSGMASIPDTITQNRRRDFTGATSLARTVLSWFPHFSQPYQEYLHVSEDLSMVIPALLSETSSGLPYPSREVGEQQLRSLLIEPVQRLPRYTLFIDNILSLLPASHMARSNLLKARNIMANICSLDLTDGENGEKIAKVLQNIVSDWPASLKPKGRLITAVDAVELSPPFDHASQGMPSILIIFSGKLVIVRQTKEDSMSARGLLGEIEQSRSIIQSNAWSGSGFANGLHLIGTYNLKDVQITESSNGHLVYLTVLPSTSLLPHETLSIRTIVFSLKAPYYGKAARFAEEVAKARIEGRYPLNTRESEHWSLRCLDNMKETVGILTAVTEIGRHQSLQNQYDLGQIRIQVTDSAEGTSAISLNAGAVIFGSLCPSDTGEAILEIESSDGPRFKDACKEENLRGLLQSRLTNFLSLPTNQSAQHSVSFNAQVLSYLPLEAPKTERLKQARPRSPVKLLTSMLGVGNDQSFTQHRSRSRATTIEDTPLLQLAGNSTLKTSQEGVATDTPVKQVNLGQADREIVKTSLQLLEDTFLAYIIALRSRSGNVVGKSLQARASADELRVNELYNTLLEEPTSHEVTAVMSVDILFAAFEKFLRIAWRERMGPLLTPSVAKDILSTFDSRNPTAFAHKFKESLDDMSPQNKRAFAATIRLLSDLLDASGNDGDRGILIASFAEALILVGNPHDYITLLDRVVEDYDALFEDLMDVGGSTTSTASPLSRTRSFNTSSLTSNASSLRRKFGLGGGLTRENSKNESESKVSSIWRTLSKTSKTPADSSHLSSISKPSLTRSKSTETDSRMGHPSRPVSRDRPTTSGSMASAGSNSRPGSSHLNFGGLSSIGEDPVRKFPSVLRKKRRSSLSDLHTLKATDLSPSLTPLQLLKPDEGRIVTQGVKTSSPSPSLVQKESQTPLNRRSPQRSSIPRFTSPDHKENSPLQSRNVAKSPSPSAGAVTITSHSPRKVQTSQLNKATPRTGLSERPWPPNANIPPSSPQKSPQKMRVQSPQKLRQRLSQEQKSASASHSSLQTEIDKIGQELSAMGRPGSSGQSSTGKIGQRDIQNLTARLNALETQLRDFTTREKEKATTPSLKPDLQEQLLNSERKVKKLDELYKEANAENEALYDRFNDDLGKVLARVRKGEGVSEMKIKLAETQSEVTKLRAENAKLKREALNSADL